MWRVWNMIFSHGTNGSLITFLLQLPNILLLTIIFYANVYPWLDCPRNIRSKDIWYRQLVYQSKKLTILRPTKINHSCLSYLNQLKHFFDLLVLLFHINGIANRNWPIFISEKLWSCVISHPIHIDWNTQGWKLSADPRNSADCLTLPRGIPRKGSIWAIRISLF